MYVYIYICLEPLYMAVDRWLFHEMSCLEHTESMNIKRCHGCRQPMPRPWVPWASAKLSRWISSMNCDLMVFYSDLMVFDSDLMVFYSDWTVMYYDIPSGYD